MNEENALEIESKPETLPTVGETPTKPLASGPNTDERTRMWIALGYVIGYFVIIAAALLTAYMKNYQVDDYKDLLLAVSGVLSGPLGFIVGYYFKTSN